MRAAVRDILYFRRVRNKRGLFYFFFSRWYPNVDEDELPFNIYIKVKRIEFEEVHDSDIRMIFGYDIRIYRFLSVSTNLNRLLSNYTYNSDVLGKE